MKQGNEDVLLRIMFNVFNGLPYAHRRVVIIVNFIYRDIYVAKQ